MPQIFLKNPFAKKLLAKFHEIPLFGENFCVSSGTNIFPFSKTKRLGTCPCNKTYVKYQSTFFSNHL